ncbi:MAG: SCP2 sterol-binding domain-containing protein [Burkholderiales bacterium]
MNPPVEPSLIPAPLATLISRLPQWPHSAALAALLNVAVLPVLDAETRRRLADRPLAIKVLDVGVDCRVWLKPIGFLPLARRHPPAVSIRASAADFYRLARRLEDPDTLFFARRLVIEGDTELGLCLKNALDAIDWTRLPAELLKATARVARRFAPGAARGTDRPIRPNG